MLEYINREALINAIPTVNEDKEISLYGAVADFINLISSMPTADVAEVVRCKDCRLYEDGLCYHKQWFNDDDTPIVKESDFCSYGERKTDD